MRCIFCNNPADTGKIYFDIKNRPYFYDPLCGNRIFFRSHLALRAILAWSETAKTVSQEDFLAMLHNQESSRIYRNDDVQKWVKKVEKPEEVISRGNRQEVMANG